jgi:SAM-dependent methyltransferase
MQVLSSELDQWVSASDACGGPMSSECTQFWHEFSLKYTTHVDVSLDPFSEEYCSQQIALYNEVAGRPLDQKANELTVFQKEAHINASNPYAHQAPLRIAEHVALLTEAVLQGQLPASSRILDMGAGWGLSSEVFAYFGYEVHAVDINSEFVSLIEARARRLVLPITAHVGCFDTFDTLEKFDLCFFYECLHHAVRPWTVIDRVKHFLSPNGQIVAAGEPLNCHWWPSWGLRLDALSVYCIRKFGWFENGWSEAFIRDCFAKSGLSMWAIRAKSGQNNIILKAFMPVSRLNAELDVGQETPVDISVFLDRNQFYVEPEYWVAQTSFQVHKPKGASFTLRLNGTNHRASALLVKQIYADGSLFEQEIQPGAFTLELNLSKGPFMMLCETWIPAAEIGNGDWREISLHIHCLQAYLCRSF